MTLPVRRPLTETQRDNLNIGIYLAGRQGGAPLDDILQAAVGYAPNGGYPQNVVEIYERRFRAAQRLGRDQYRARIAGYFTFNATPFGHTYYYKITWYTLVNPQTGNCQTVPMNSLDLRGMRQFSDTYLNTRQATARSIRTAHDIEEERDAIARQDFVALRNIQSRMVEDGGLGEILSGLHGLPYADIEEIVTQLPAYMQRNVRFSFQQSANNIKSLNRRLRQEQARIANQLTHWVMIQTGLPNNAPQLALQDAIARITVAP